MNQGSEEPFFFLSMQLKDQISKLIAKNDNPSNSSELIVSSKTKDGFNNVNKTLWQIVPN